MFSSVIGLQYSYIGILRFCVIFCLFVFQFMFPVSLTSFFHESLLKIFSILASCPTLPQLSDGYKYGRSRTHGSSVQFRCAYGHKLIGSSRVVCNDGSWSHRMPKCLGKLCHIKQS